MLKQHLASVNPDNVSFISQLQIWYHIFKIFQMFVVQLVDFYHLNNRPTQQWYHWWNAAVAAGATEHIIHFCLYVYLHELCTLINILSLNGLVRDDSGFRWFEWTWNLWWIFLSLISCHLAAVVCNKDPKGYFKKSSHKYPHVDYREFFFSFLVI